MCSRPEVSNPIRSSPPLHKILRQGCAASDCGVKFILLPAMLSVCLHSAQALEIPPGGTEIGSSLKATVNAEAGKAVTLEKGARITVEKSDAAKAYLAQFTVPCVPEIKPDEPLLAVIKARVLGPSSKGVVTAKLQLQQAPYTALSPDTTLEIHPEWTELPLTLVPNKSADAGMAALVLLCGQKEQTLEVESVRLLSYPAKTDIATFPRIRRTYAGREAQALWRKAALERIEKHRQADLTLTLTDPTGQPLKNTEVRVVLQRHEFGFGSAVPVKWLVEDSQDGRNFRNIVDRLFSIVVFENDLKEGEWSPEASAEKRQQRNAQLDQAFAWLEARHIPVRGHYLMQVATPYNLHGINDAEVIRQRILEGTRERLGFVKNRVREWDVINHPIAWHGADMLNAKPGLAEIDRETYRLARSLTDLPFWVNEDQIFRPGPQQERTFTYIQALNEAGLPVAGLGNQAHFDESFLPSPEELLAVTDRYAKIVPSQSITEFDVVTQADEDLAADYTRDMLIACFSHPAYSSILLWGFWEGSHWKPEAASWNKDWSIRPRGEVLEEWIGRRWRTDVTLKTDASGQVNWRGFPGDYLVTTYLESGAASSTATLHHQKPAGRASLQKTSTPQP